MPTTTASRTRNEFVRRLTGDMTDGIVLLLAFAPTSIFVLFKPLSDHLSCMFYSVILFDLM